MHTLTEKRVNKFARDFGFEGDLDSIFELYVAATYLYRQTKDDVSLIQDAVTGGKSDEGIDIAAVIVNGQIVHEPSDIDDLVGEQPSNTAQVVFIQAKTSERYDTKLIAKFLHGVEIVTRYAMHPDSVNLPTQLVDVAILIDRIAEHGDKFQEVRIPCKLYYVTTSSHRGEQAEKELQVQQALKRINDLGMYSPNLTLNLHGYEQLAEKQKERQGPQRVKFTFERRQTIPTTDGVDEAYIGLITAQQLKALLMDGEDVRPGIFDDNVRLHLGANNPVNQRISETLYSQHRGQFPFLNNGLTVIATKLETQGDNFLASGYQIVNGGQTSHQIMQWMGSKEVREDESLLSSLWIPIKIISSTDPDVRSRVTVATNLQTAISNADIQSSTQMAKDVEEFFARTGPEGLRYERQGRENGISFPRTRVVSTSDINRAVSATILGESSRAIASPKELEGDSSPVWKDYPVEAYYYAAWIVYRIERYFAREASRSALKAAKYHIAMLVSVMAVPKLAVCFNANDKSVLQHTLKNVKYFSKIDSDDELRQKIESAIPDAASLVEKHFEDVLREGRSLRKDDVRSRKHQTELFTQVARTAD
ncbi:AIPR family protein [Actinomyces procaprae]|uniref:AIPR family protein n=1 Tax=Actinomyces procaprae TaxID=2560010 RepID=UPI00109DC112|nr:AIPR family protein [Actinomyces procaprae]